MTLASCIARNITKSERHVENAFRLVNHPVNPTPMWDGLLPSSDSGSATVFQTVALPGFDYVLGANSTIIKRAIGMCPPLSKLITSPYASGRAHRVESRTHRVSDVPTERNNAALHTAEIAVAIHRAAEIE